MWNSIAGWKEPMVILLHCLQAYEIVHSAPADEPWAIINILRDIFKIMHLRKCSDLLSKVLLLHLRLSGDCGEENFLNFCIQYDPCAPVWQEAFCTLRFTAAAFCILFWNLSPWRQDITEVSGNFIDFTAVLWRLPAVAAWAWHWFCLAADLVHSVTVSQVWFDCAFFLLVMEADCLRHSMRFLFADKLSVWKLLGVSSSWVPLDPNI